MGLNRAAAKFAEWAAAGFSPPRVAGQRLGDPLYNVTSSRPSITRFALHPEAVGGLDLEITESV